MAATVKAKFVVQRDDQKSLTRIDPYEGVVEDLDVYVAGCLDPGTKFVLRKPDGGAAFNTDNELASYLGTASPPTVVVDIGHTLPFSITGADGVPRSFKVGNVQFGMEVCDLIELVCKVGTSPPHNFRFISDWSMLLLVDPNAIPMDKRAAFVNKFCMPASAAAESLQRLKDRARLDEDFFFIFHGKSKHSLFIHNSAPASAAAASFSGAQILGAAACPQPDQSAFSAQLGTLTQGIQRLGIGDECSSAAAPATPPRGKPKEPATPHRATTASFPENIVPELIELAGERQLHVLPEEYRRRAQREEFGPFFREDRLFPTGIKAVQLFSMGAFFNESGAVPRSEAGDSVYKLVDQAVEKHLKQVFVMIGKSGCGKTSTVLEIGKKHFVIYIDVFENLARPGFFDLPKPRDKEIENWDVAKAIKHNLFLKDSFRARFFPYVITRLLHLIALRRSKPSLTPEEFFRDQLNGGKQYVAEHFNRVGAKLQDFSSTQMFGILQKVLDVVKEKIGEPPVLALDEAQTAEKHFPPIPQGLLSHEAEIDPSGSFWWNDSKQIPHFGHQRGGLSLLYRVAMDVVVPLVVCGTSLSLKNAEQAISSTAKHDYEIYRIIRFPMCKDPWGLLESVLNLDGCTKPKDIDKLRGRFRFSASVLAKIPTSLNGQKKQKALEHAIQKALDSSREQLEDSICKLIHSKGDVARNLLERLLVAHDFSHHNIAWHETDSFFADYLVDNIASVTSARDIVLRLNNEPLVFDAIRKVLESSTSSITANLVSLLYDVRSILGEKTPAKGCVLEPIIRQTLALYNGVAVSELPFVRGIRGRLPEWAMGSKVCIERVGTAEELGFREDSQSMADARFLEAKKPGDLLVPANSTRPDAVAFLAFDHERLRRSTRLEEPLHLLTCGIRFGCKPLGISCDHGHEDNVNTTDPKNFFLTKASEVNAPIQASRKLFKTVLPQIKGSLRIHVELPCVSGLHLASEVDGNDILVFVTLNELDLFFNEDFFKDQRIKVALRAIKSFLRNFFDPSPAPAPAASREGGRKKK